MVCLIPRTPSRRDELARRTAARLLSETAFSAPRHVNAAQLANQLTKAFWDNQEHLFGTNDGQSVINPRGLTESFLLVMKTRSAATDGARDS